MTTSITVKSPTNYTKQTAPPDRTLTLTSETLEVLFEIGTHEKCPLAVALYLHFLNDAMWNSGNMVYTRNHARVAGIMNTSTTKLTKARKLLKQYHLIEDTWVVNSNGRLRYTTVWLLGGCDNAENFEEEVPVLNESGMIFTIQIPPLNLHPEITDKKGDK